MRFTRLVPNIFYEDMKDGPGLIFLLEFSIGHNELISENSGCVVQNDELSIFFFQNKESACKGRPEIRLHTDDIDDVYAKVSRTHPQFLHSNLKTITLRPGS